MTYIVYEIHVEGAGRYFGYSSESFGKRITRHIYALRTGKHACAALRYAYNKQGGITKLYFHVLLETSSRRTASEELARLVRETPDALCDVTYTEPKPVKCLRTGRVYRDPGEAAAAYGGFASILEKHAYYGNIPYMGELWAFVQ